MLLGRALVFLGIVGALCPVWGVSPREEAEALVRDSLSQAESFEIKQEAERVVEGSLETEAPSAPDSGFKEGRGCSGASDSSAKCSEEAPSPGGSSFLVFVSFSMPEGSLKSLSQEIKALRGRVILKGLMGNSFQKTQRKLLELGLEGEIDPLLFEQYAIERVPTYVLAQGSTYDQVAGHISPRAALELFQERGSLKAPASEVLSRREVSR